MHKPCIITTPHKSREPPEKFCADKPPEKHVNGLTLHTQCTTQRGARACVCRAAVRYPMSHSHIMWHTSSCINLIMHSKMGGTEAMHYEEVDCIGSPTFRRIQMSARAYAAPACHSIHPKNEFLRWREGSFVYKIIEFPSIAASIRQWPSGRRSLRALCFASARGVVGCT